MANNKASTILKDALVTLKNIVQQCVDDDDQKFFFIAHLFVTCEYLIGSYKNAFVDFLENNDEKLPQELLSRKPSWENLLKILEEIDNFDPPIAYYQLLVLLIITEDLMPLVNSVDGVARVIKLSFKGNASLLTGKVHVWVSPSKNGNFPFSIKTLKKKRADHIGEPTSFLRTVDKLRNFGMVWDKLIGRPEVRVKIPCKNRQIMFNEWQNDTESSLKIALCPLIENDFRPQFAAKVKDKQKGVFQINQENKYIRLESLEKHIDKILNAIEENKIHILIFPELTVPQEIIRKILERPKSSYPFLIIPGSFHFLENDHKVYNISHVCDPFGIIWKHKKRGSFFVREALFQNQYQKFLDGNPILFNKFEFEDGSKPWSKNLRLKENIEYGNSITIYDTPFGSIAAIICADAIDLTAALGEIIEESRIDLLIIVSMTPKTDDFRRIADELNRGRIAILFVNAADVCPFGEDLAFSYLPIKEPNKKMVFPTRIRWTKQGFVQWNNTSFNNTKYVVETNDSATYYLKDYKNNVMGMVVNFGAYFHEEL